MFFDISTKDSVISLKDSYIELDFEVTHFAGPHNCYINDDGRSLVSLAALDLLTENNLPSSIEKH